MKRTKTFIDLTRGATIRQLTVPYDPLEEVSTDDVREACSEMSGEVLTGYEDPVEGEKDLGDFNCRNCEYALLNGSLCQHSVMKKFSKRPRSRDGNVIVSALGCCSFLARKGLYFQGIRKERARGGAE